MKRAILATAGTLTGLVSVLSYSPGSPTMPLADGSLSGSGLGGPAGLGGPSGGTAEAPAGSSAGHVAVAGRPAAPAAKAPKAGAARPKTSTPVAAGPAASTPAKAAAPAAAAPTTAHAVAAPVTTAAASAAKAAPAPKVTSAPKLVTVPKSTSAPQPAPTPTVSAPKDVRGAAVTYKYGTLQMAIRVQGGKITDAWAISYPAGESQPYSEMAIPILRTQTLQAQSAHIAGASGASYTTQAWIKSLQSALTQAGLA